MAEKRRFEGSEEDVGIHRLEIDGNRVPLLGGMGFTERPWLLYVRAAGRTLCDLIMSSASDKGKRIMDRYVVTGTPGTGKSAFANYFVARLLAMGKTVYYMYGTQGLVLEPSAGGRAPRATKYDEKVLPDFKTLVQNAAVEDSWCVLDAVQPSVSWGIPTLVVTSPREELYKEWLKQGKGRRYFMPLPTFEEIRELSSALDTCIDDAALEECIKVGGHVFRYVADNACTLQEMRQRASEAVGAVDLDRIKESVGGVKRDTETNSRMVHINVPRCATHGWRFASPEYLFASDFVCELVFQRAKGLLDDDTWWALLNGLWQLPRIYNPVLFEEMAQRRLCLLGAQLQVRSVDGPAAFYPTAYEDDGSFLLTISAAPLDRQTFRKIADVDPSRNGTLWIPEPLNFPLVDGLCFEKNASASFCLQCTAKEGTRTDDWTNGTQKVTIARELTELWRDTFGDAPLRLLYVVPHTLWRDQKVVVEPPQGIKICVYVCRLV